MQNGCVLLSKLASDRIGRDTVPIGDMEEKAHAIG